MSHLNGPNNGDWSVFAAGVVEERDALRAQIDSVTRERDAKEREIQRLLNVVCSAPACTADVVRREDGSRVCAAGHSARWVNVDLLTQAERERDDAQVRYHAERENTDREMSRAEKAEAEVARLMRVALEALVGSEHALSFCRPDNGSPSDDIAKMWRDRNSALDAARAAIEQLRAHVEGTPLEAAVQGYAEVSRG